MIGDTNHPNFKRDLTNGALLNTNVEEFQMLKAQRNRINKTDQELELLKSELHEVKSLLSRMVQTNG
jgi:hypothetical protein